MELARTIRHTLTEGPMSYLPPAPSKFDVVYTVRTPRGSETKFTRSSTLTHVRGAMSETAIKGYLQSLHPGTEVSIYRLKFI